MFEIVIMLVGALPFLVGLYAIKLIRDHGMGDSDDPPPPPDPEPPAPSLPPTPRPRHRKRPAPSFHDHRPVPHHRLSSPRWPQRINKP